jgi:N-acetylglutamate synthase-like GNAT family acetyltransferase
MEKFIFTESQQDFYKEKGFKKSLRDVLIAEKQESNNTTMIKALEDSNLVTVTL